MKKLISVMICLLVILQFWIGVITESNNEMLELSKLEEQYCQRFSIPENDSINDPEKVYTLLKEAARETNANLFRTLLIKKEDDSLEMTKFVLMTSESEYYAQFEIKDGENFNIENSQTETGTNYLSTKQTEDTDQIGQLATHIYDIDITIRTLNQQTDYFKESGLYYVELPDGCSKEEFLGLLKEKLENTFYVSLADEDFESGINNVGLPYTDTGMLFMLKWVAIVLIILCAMYYYFREHKQVAVLNLFGIENWKAVFLMQKEFYALYLVTLVLSSAAALLYTGDAEYVWQILKPSLQQYVYLIVLLYALGMIFQREGNVHAHLNGKDSTGGVYILNYLAKLVCILVVLYLGQNVHIDYQDYITGSHMYAGWEDAQAYGVLYPFYTGYEMTGDEQTETEIVVNTELYRALNQDGALYIDASDYEEENMLLNIDYTGYLSVTVNPNYLQQYPILDTEGTQVVIEEEEKDWILLVPEQYRDQEKEILAQFQESREGSIWVDEDIYQKEVPDCIKQQEIKIIWIDGNQGVFSFNPEVYSNQGNMIYNTIVQVMTLDNSCISDRNCVLGSGDRDPFKIRLQGDSKDTYEKWYSLLNDLKLDDNLRHIVSCNESAQENLGILQQNILLAIRMLLITLAVYLLLSEQNIAIWFDRNRKNLIIKRIYGWNWSTIYGKHLLEHIVVLLCMTGVYGFLNPMGQLNQQYLRFAILLMVVVECILLWLETIRLEKKKIVNTIKGE